MASCQKKILILRVLFFIAIILLIKMCYKMLNNEINVQNGEEFCKFISQYSDKKQIVTVFNLSNNLEPKNLYDSIKCRESANVFVRTTLCVHDIKRDTYVSESIWRTGVWELNILSAYMEYINNNPDWLVLDIGSQIGQYSLFPAKLGRNVLTVEPFYDNILRIHKAANISNTSSRITLVTNAISNKRGEIKMLEPNKNNIGAQGLVQNMNRVINIDQIDCKDPRKRYFVKTILFNDIVSYLPLNKDGNRYEKAIMKIDIESFEPYAFQYADILFDTLDIRVVFMEFGYLRLNYLKMTREIEEMLGFFESRYYYAYPIDNNKTKLDPINWKKSWPWDLVWKKEDGLQ